MMHWMLTIIYLSLIVPYTTLTYALGDNFFNMARGKVITKILSNVLKGGSISSLHASEEIALIPKSRIISSSNQTDCTEEETLIRKRSGKTEPLSKDKVSFAMRKENY
jgi:hypothetical protein